MRNDIIFRLLFSAVLVSFISSCREKENSLPAQVQGMATLECRAITLRKQRYILADQIRFAQDTVLHFGKLADTNVINQEILVFFTQKDSLLQASLRLADTIHFTLDSLRKYYFTNKEEKHRFDEQLKAELKKMGCEE